MCSGCGEELARIKELIKKAWITKGERWAAIKHVSINSYETVPEISLPLLEDQVKKQEIEIVFTLKK